MRASQPVTVRGVGAFGATTTSPSQTTTALTATALTTAYAYRAACSAAWVQAGRPGADGPAQLEPSTHAFRDELHNALLTAAVEAERAERRRCPIGPVLTREQIAAAERCTFGT